MSEPRAASGFYANNAIRRTPSRFERPGLILGGMQRYVFVMVWALSLVAAPAHAFSFKALFGAFRPPVERWVERIDDARQHGQSSAASQLLEQAEKAVGTDQPQLLRLRGMLLLEGGQLAEAAEMFRRSADLDGSSDARVTQAAALVALGRWPESVEVLKRAFDERGGGLRSDSIASDERFVKLTSFEPYQKLMRSMREQEAGPFGRLLLRFEEIEASVSAAWEVLAVVGRILGVLGQLCDIVGSGVIFIVLFGIVFSMGINQLGLLRPPWMLVLGLVPSSLLWMAGVRIATGGRGYGLADVAGAYGVILGPWLLVIGVRWLVRRVHQYRNRRGGRGITDELDALPRVLSAAEQFAVAGRHWLAASPEDRNMAEERMKASLASLRLCLGVELPVIDTTGERGARAEASAQRASESGGDTASSLAAPHRPKVSRP